MLSGELIDLTVSRFHNTPISKLMYVIMYLYKFCTDYPCNLSGLLHHKRLRFVRDAGVMRFPK